MEHGQAPEERMFKEDARTNCRAGSIRRSRETKVRISSALNGHDKARNSET